MSEIKAIITDIEGTTTSISFVYDILFPYFRNNITQIDQLLDNDLVAKSITETQKIIKTETGKTITQSEAIKQLKEWSLADRKIGPLKNIQGVIWEKGYETGEIKGHVYDDVPAALEKWKNQSVLLGIYSSGSAKAQQLLFGYSVNGNLNSYFKFNFDLNIGQKREVSSYQKIANELKMPSNNILFLSDIEEELDAAKEAGFKTIQLVREGTTASTKHTVVSTFSEINL